MTNDTRDVIARALFKMDGIEPPVDRGRAIWHNYLTDADAILAAIAAKGLVIADADDADAAAVAAARDAGYADGIADAMRAADMEKDAG